jgi:hypothetical protein
MQSIIMPMSIPVMVTSSLGPYLSVNLPVTMAKRPPRKVQIENAADKAPRSHPNSLARGSRKTLKVPVRVPSATRIIREQVTITQPYPIFNLQYLLITICFTVIYVL